MAHIRQVYTSIGGGPGDECDLDNRKDKHLNQGFDFVIDKTWDNKPIDHDPIKVHMNWVFAKQLGQPHKRVIRAQIEAPLFDDPDPPNESFGHCSDLYNYECVEFFFMNEQGHYLEVEVGPHGHWLVLFFDGYRHGFNLKYSEEVVLEVENKFDMDKWICTVDIPLAFIPGNITRFNAYALHKSGEERHYEALGPVKDGSLKEPDFHRKEYFTRIDTRRVIPEGYNRKAFNDLKYGDVWASVNETD